MNESQAPIEPASAISTIDDDSQSIALRPGQDREVTTRVTRTLQTCAALGLAAMVIAIFLPWTSFAGSGQGLSQYGAPAPSVVAWLLIAIGLATTLVAAAAWLFTVQRAPLFLLFGAVMYLAGSCLWYFSTIFPGVVASGCNSSGGPLCNSPAASPMVSGSGVAAGMVLGVLGSVIVTLIAAITPRVLASRRGELLSSA